MMKKNIKLAQIKRLLFDDDDPTLLSVFLKSTASPEVPSSPGKSSSQGQGSRADPSNTFAFAIRLTQGAKFTESVRRRLEASGANIRRSDD